MSNNSSSSSSSNADNNNAVAQDPKTTAIDQNCATFVRDALFPLRRDWGSGRNHQHHSQIHPALNALDRLRAELVEKRTKSMSYSNVFPRGVLLVAKSDAVGNDSSSSSSSSTYANSSTTNMEYNGQPDVEESTATVEVIPNVLTVKCMRCDDAKFKPSSNRDRPPYAFMRTKETPYKRAKEEHELVVCSDRVLQRDYYRQFGNNDDSSSSGRGYQRREDLPIRSMKAVEETLARELTKLRVHSDENDDDDDGDYHKKNNAVSYPMLSSSSSSSSKTSSKPSCDEYAGLELMAARAAECMLLRNTNEVRMGSALRPSSSLLFSMLPSSIQQSFTDRCVRSVATKYTTAAAARDETGGLFPNKDDVPKECVRRAWNNRNNK